MCLERHAHTVINGRGNIARGLYAVCRKSSTKTEIPPPLGRNRIGNPLTNPAWAVTSRHERVSHRRRQDFDTPASARRRPTQTWRYTGRSILQGNACSAQTGPTHV